jgi:hypothetical protein
MSWPLAIDRLWATAIAAASTWSESDGSPCSALVALTSANSSLADPGSSPAGGAGAGSGEGDGSGDGEGDGDGVGDGFAGGAVVGGDGSGAGGHPSSGTGHADPAPSAPNAGTETIPNPANDAPIIPITTKRTIRMNRFRSAIPTDDQRRHKSADAGRTARNAGGRVARGVGRFPTRDEGNTSDMGTCERCRGSTVDVPTTIGGHQLMMRRCSQCDRTEWRRGEAVIDLREVLDLTAEAHPNSRRPRRRADADEDADADVGADGQAPSVGNR